jgi:hypothetical protein
LTYTVEIELPSSGKWFKHSTGIESREEAESIRRVAEGKLKARMKRDRLKIIAEILQAAKNGAKKTHIMYQCNLSYHQTKRFLASSE